jgi:hypothetical protein
MALNGNTAIGGNGWTNQCVPQAPVSDYQQASDRWYRAKELLNRRLAESNDASANLQSAQSEEQQAWECLEGVAGRSVVSKCTTASVGYGGPSR